MVTSPVGEWGCQTSRDPWTAKVIPLVSHGLTFMSDFRDDVSGQEHNFRNFCFEIKISYHQLITLQDIILRTLNKI